MKKIITLSLLLSSFLLANENTMLTVGVQLGYGSTNETLSNTTGSVDYNYDVTSYKLLVGKDYDLYDKGQTSRFYGSYKYNSLSSDTSYSTLGIGYLENMTYLSFLNKPEQKVFPYAGLELGWSLGDLGDSKNAFNTEVDLGLTYQFKNMEFSLGYAYNFVSWDNTEATDNFNNHQVVLGYTYKFMNGEK